MDFRQSTQSNGRSSAAPTPVGPTTGSAPVKPSKNDNGGEKSMKLMRLLNLAILVGIAVLIAGIAFAFTRNSQPNEVKYVNSSKYQAVFLTNGQVYFGHIGDITKDYVELNNIYYLTQTGTTEANATTTNNSNYTLVKLGCQQIHNPYDQMLINRGQVTFWENMNDDGQVAKKIAEFKKTYPNGPDCSQVSSQTQAPTTNTQSTPTGTGTTTKQ